MLNAWRRHLVLHLLFYMKGSNSRLQCRYTERLIVSVSGNSYQFTLQVVRQSRTVTAFDSKMNWNAKRKGPSPHSSTPLTSPLTALFLGEAEACWPIRDDGSGTIQSSCRGPYPRPRQSAARPGCWGWETRPSAPAAQLVGVRRPRPWYSAGSDNQVRTCPPGVNFISPSQSFRAGVKGGSGGANALWDSS